MRLRFNYLSFYNLRHYWFLISLILITLIRVDLSCFYEKCLVDEQSLYSFIDFKLFENLREHSITTFNKNFSSPHSELLLGMTVGIDNLHKVPSFKNALKTTGTIHVVVVSGFNISLVFNTILNLLKSKFKFRNLFIAQAITIFYCALTGFEPPIVRALIMGSIVNWATYLGRGVNTFLVIFTSVFLITALEPRYLFSLSFILSTFATLGLVLFSPLIFNTIDSYIDINNVIVQDFVAGLSATIFVWPIISYFFGSISLISLLVNTLILWTVSFTTIIGTIYLLISLLFPLLSQFLVVPLYVLSNIFVEGVNFFNNLKIGYYDYKLNLAFMTFYYIFIFFSLAIYSFKRSTCES